jgi:hypothetical protein
MSCEYCRGTKYLIEREQILSRRGNFYPGIDVGIYGNVLFVEGSADTYEPNYIGEGIKINFCPMCGEKIELELREDTI